MEIYNKMSSEYDSLFVENMLQFQNSLQENWNSNGWFTNFYPSLGVRQKEPCDLLFYGQALNGWASGFDVYDAVSETQIKESITASNRYFAKLGHSPLDWVNVRWSNDTYDQIVADPTAKKFYDNKTDYRTFRSFFWKAVYKLTSDYYGYNRSSWDWSKKIAWSNLYKIAPDGENPNSFLKVSQLDIAAQLIALEIEELQPKYCIVLTNYSWWAPFKSLLQTRDIEYDQSLTNIVAFEEFKGTKIIVTTRPRFGNAETHVNHLLALIK
ncbi:MAG: hypothetical protein K2X37_14350 [Chitinophagaceae bacterium]|nr:hypothetical protein [Chitinophagaceae bacterium]